MTIHPIAKRFAILTGILVLVGAGFWWTQSSGKRAAEQKTDSPRVAEAQVANVPTKDDPAQAEKERAQALIEKLKGTRKVVYSEGELPNVKLPNGTKLQKPMFYLIGMDELTWDNGNPNDAARLVRFDVRYPEEQQIDISENATFPQSYHYLMPRSDDALLSTENKNDALPPSDTVYGMYAFGGEHLRLRWGTNGCPCDFSAWQFWEEQNYSVVLQRVNANDPQLAAREKAADAPDLQALQGRWRITKVVGAQDADVKVGHDFFFQGDRLKIFWRDNNDIARSFGPFAINASANPKQIVCFNDECPSANSGIYRLDKDRLEICWCIDQWSTHNLDEKQKTTPNKFEVGKNDKTIQLIQLERVDAVAERTAAEKIPLIDLQKALVETLQAQINGLEERIRDGKESISSIVDPVEKRMKAQLALAPDKKFRIQITESYLQRLLKCERILEAEEAAGKAADQDMLVGKVTEQDVAQVKAKRLMAEILLEKEKAEAGDNKRLVELQKALVEISQARVNFLESRIQAGKDSCAMVLEAADHLMTAQLALAADKKSRLQVLETNLRRLVDYERICRSEFEGGKSFPNVLPQVKAKRLMAEILLEKEKRQ